MNATAMLEDLGYTVLGAASAKQALEIVRRERPVDVVITDQVMPQMTGVELASAIRAEYPNLPVIVATGYAELPPGEHPGLSVLAKPFRQKDLVQAILESIKGQQARSRILKFGRLS
jgi:CheY-like chemotaxis protein